MKTGPHSPSWMMRLYLPKQLRTTLSILKCFSSLRVHMSWTESSARNVIPMVCRLVLCTNILSWTLTHVNEVHFPGGHTNKLVSNTITEALYALCDSDGNQFIMFDSIVDYCKNPNVAISCHNQVKIVNSKKVSNAPPEVGSCAVNGRMAVLLYRSCQSSESLTLVRLLSLHLPWALLMNQPSTGG